MRHFYVVYIVRIFLGGKGRLEMIEKISFAPHKKVPSFARDYITKCYIYITTFFIV